MTPACCSCGATPTTQQPTACATCRARWGLEPIITMVDMGDGIYLSAQTVRKEDVDAFCARLREMAR